MLIITLVGALSVLGLGIGWHLRESTAPCGPIVETVVDMVQDLTVSSESVMGIAHNAAAGTKEVRRAIDCGAAVIEVDVIEAEGQLLASHDRALESGSREDPLLEAIWPVAAEATMIKLDPKFPSPELTRLLVAFLDDTARTSETKVAVTTSDVDMLETLHERAPEVQRFLTLETKNRWRHFATIPSCWS